MPLGMEQFNVFRAGAEEFFLDAIGDLVLSAPGSGETGRENALHRKVFMKKSGKLGKPGGKVGAAKPNIIQMGTRE